LKMGPELDEQYTLLYQQGLLMLVHQST